MSLFLFSVILFIWRAAHPSLKPRGRRETSLAAEGAPPPRRRCAQRRRRTSSAVRRRRSTASSPCRASSSPRWSSPCASPGSSRSSSRRASRRSARRRSRLSRSPRFFVICARLAVVRLVFGLVEARLAAHRATAAHVLSCSRFVHFSSALRVVHFSSVGALPMGFGP